MKVLVPVKRVIDHRVKIRVKTDQSGVVTDQVKMAVNPFDEIAVEEAVRLKEKGIAKEVVVVSIGEAACQETLRKALALGADRGLLLTTGASLQPLAIAKLLQWVVQQESPDLVILGKQAIDDDCNQVGQMLAGLLHWAQGTFAAQIVIKADERVALVTRELDQGLETVRLQLPAVITADLRLNKPRHISLPNLMQAKQKLILVKPVTETGIVFTSSVQLLSVTEPPPRKAGMKLDHPDDLLDLLKTKVLC